MSRVPVCAAGAVAVAAALLAATATHDVAIAEGAVANPALAWAMPIALEGAAMTAAALAFDRRRQGRDARAERAMLCALIALATVVNAAHAGGGHPLGMVLAAMPPLVLLASVEVLLRANVVVQEERAATQAAETRKARAAAKRAVAAAPELVPRKAPQPKPKPLSDERLAVVRQMLDEQGRVTGDQVGERLGVSAATGRRLLAKAAA